jgi:hypothetical protein
MRFLNEQKKSSVGQASAAVGSGWQQTWLDL